MTTDIPIPTALYLCAMCRDDYSWPAEDLVWVEKDQRWVCNECYDSSMGPRGTTLAQEIDRRKTTSQPEQIIGGSLQRRVLLPPAGLKMLDDLAWRIGRDDAAQLLPPHRCENYRGEFRKMYLAGYRAQQQYQEQNEGVQPRRPGGKTFPATRRGSTERDTE